MNNFSIGLAGIPDPVELKRAFPDPAEFEEILGMLLAANDAGELKSVVFVLQQPGADSALVDYRGSYELTEMACRTVRGRIADAVQSARPDIAKRIRDDLDPAKAH